MKRAVVLLFLTVLTGCATSASSSNLQKLPQYHTGDCFRYTTASRHEVVGQVQIVKDTQYYVQVHSENGANYQYFDLIPFAQLEQTGTPTPCSDMYPPLPLDTPTERKTSPKQP